MSWFWPFGRKKSPTEPRDCRVWNEDWRIGDTAECIFAPDDDRWADSVPPWNRPNLGEQFVVAGFVDDISNDGSSRHYFLKFDNWPVCISCTAFRKVRPVASEKSEIVERILTAKPGADRVREDA